MIVLDGTLLGPSQTIHLNELENHEKIKKRSELFARISKDHIADCMHTIPIDKGSVSVGNTEYW